MMHFQVFCILCTDNCLLNKSSTSHLRCDKNTCGFYFHVCRTVNERSSTRERERGRERDRGKRNVEYDRIFSCSMYSTLQIVTHVTC